MCLGGARKRKLDSTTRRVFNFRFELDQRRHNVRALHLDDQWQ